MRSRYGTVAALRQEHRLTFGLADARIVEIDVDDRRLLHVTAFLPLLEADQERAARDHAGHVARVPAARSSRNRFSSFAKPSSATDRNSPVFGSLRKKIGYSRWMSAYSVGKVITVPTLSPNSAPMARDHAQILVRDVVEHYVSGHLRPRIPEASKRRRPLSTSGLLIIITLYEFCLELVAGSQGVTSTLVFQTPQLQRRSDRASGCPHPSG